MTDQTTTTKRPRVGDVDPTPAERGSRLAYCGAERGGWHCTRPYSHESTLHVAGTDEIVVAVWDDREPVVPAARRGHRR